MKHRILIALLCCCLLPLALFNSCSAEKHDLLYTVDVDGRTFAVRGKGTQAKQIVVKSGDNILWSVETDVEKNVGNYQNSYGFRVLDLNFDGKADIAQVYNLVGECAYYRCWLYSAQTDSYEESAALTGLANLKVDTKLQALFGFTHSVKSTDSPNAEGVDWTITKDAATMYRWTNGALLPEREAALTHYSETNKYCYTVSFYDEESGKLEEDQDNWLTPVEYRSKDWSFIYYFR